MKKMSLLLALPAVALSGLLLSGCGIFRSHKAWTTAQQEAPLEIPPTLDRPSTSDALVIPPPGANQPTSNGAVAVVGSVDGQVSDGFLVSDSVDNTYRRVGESLQGGKLGQVSGHDDSAHSYTLSVSAAEQDHRGFFSRMFHHKSSATDAAAQQVQVTVAASGTNASEVRAQGSAAAVAKVVNLLKSRLGG